MLRFGIFSFQIFRQICKIFYSKLFEFFNIWVKWQINMFCSLILLPYVNNSIYIMTNNNSTFQRENVFETELPDFSTLKLFNMEPRKNVSQKNYTVLMSIQGRSEWTEVLRLFIQFYYHYFSIFPGEKCISLHGDFKSVCLWKLFWRMCFLHWTIWKEKR